MTKFSRAFFCKGGEKISKIRKRYIHIFEQFLGPFCWIKHQLWHCVRKKKLRSIEVSGLRPKKLHISHSWSAKNMRGSNEDRCGNDERRKLRRIAVLSRVSLATRRSSIINARDKSIFLSQNMCHISSFRMTLRDFNSDNSGNLFPIPF